MTVSASPLPASLDVSQVLHAEFPLLCGKEHLGISFQVRPEDAPAQFYERAHGINAGERGRQASNGELFGAYKNVLFCHNSIMTLGLKVVDVYVKNKDTPKGPRSIVYFWFAPENDHRNFRDPAFYEYVVREFARLASHVYVTGESYANPDGPACITLKGIASSRPRIELSLVEGDLQVVAEGEEQSAHIAGVAADIPEPSDLEIAESNAQVAAEAFFSCRRN